MLSRDVMSAILMYQINPKGVGVELICNANSFFVSINKHGRSSRDRKRSFNGCPAVIVRFGEIKEHSRNNILGKLYFIYLILSFNCILYITNIS